MGNIDPTSGDSQIFREAGSEWNAEGGRKKISGAPRIIPGDWGKVESGWLTQPLKRARKG